MSDSVLEHFTDRIVKHPAHHGEDIDGVEEIGAMGLLRGVRERALMVEFHFKDGRILALAYAWLERVEFDPATGITLRFTNQTVRLVGRNLNAEIRPNVRLLDGLLRHRVPWVRETDQGRAMAADRNAPVIERIEVVS
jgi:hypothetical protein